MSLLAEDIPKNHRAGFAFKIRDAKFSGAFDHLRVVCARLTQASEVAFDVGHENWHTACTEILRESLQCDCLSSSSGAGDQAVTIRHLHHEVDRFLHFPADARLT